MWFLKKHLLTFRTLRNFTSPEVFSANRKIQVQQVTVQKSLMYATYDGIGKLIRNKLHKRYEI